MSGVLHGGNLAAASQRWGIPVADWLDLSTGITPWPWPVPEIPPAIWQRLPYPDEEHLDAARAYFQTPHVLPVAGSQAALASLPGLRPLTRVALPAIGYQEHAQAWRQAGHSVFTYQDGETLLRQLDDPDVCVAVVIQPNNPTAMRLPEALLLACRERLAARQGWLVVDEAFMDATPSQSVARHAGEPGLVVLRSAGKFFGLAGLRLGWVLAAPTLLHALQARLGPWAVNGPAQWLGTRMLRDTAWQASARARLALATPRQADLLRTHITEARAVAQAPLFTSLTLAAEDARWRYESLARQGILTRLWPVDDTQALLRFGLADDSQWPRLLAALA